MWQFGIGRSAATLLTAGLLVSTTAPTLGAQQSGRTLFQRSARVDQEVQFTMHGRSVQTRAVGDEDVHVPAPDIRAALPEDDGVVRVLLQDGTANVGVVQQPTAEDDYTTVIRLSAEGGGRFQRITASWLPYAERGGEVVERSDVGELHSGRYPGERTVLHWTGEVDDALEICLRGEQITYRTMSGDEPEHVHASLAPYGLPLDVADVRVHRLEGRGTMTVVQAPNARYDYTTIVRIYDPLSHAAFYDFDLTIRNR